MRPRSLGERAGSGSATRWSAGAGTRCSLPPTVLAIAARHRRPGLAGDDARDRGRGGGLDLRDVHPPAAAAAGAPAADRRVLRRAARPRLGPDAATPLFFMFMISGFFYASVLRPLPLAFVGVFATSILVNTLIAGLPQNAEAWTFYVVIIVIQTVVISAGVGHRREGHRAERGAPPDAREAGGRAGGERGAPRPAAGPGARGGDPRGARPDGARDPRHDRPGPDRDHHPARGGRPGARARRPIATVTSSNAERLARESLAEARRSVEASMPAALEAGTLPEALATSPASGPS